MVQGPVEISGVLIGESIIVTGAGSGIGRAAAIAGAAEGACVIAADIDDLARQETVSAIQSEHGTAIFVRTDVASEGEVEALVAEPVSAFAALHGAFNNAGLSQTDIALHELTIDQWRRIQSIDYDGVFLCIKHQIRAMLNGSGGSTVNTSPALGRVAVRKAAEYCGSKGGVLGLTKGASVDYGRKNLHHFARCNPYSDDSGAGIEPSFLRLTQDSRKSLSERKTRVTE